MTYAYLKNPEDIRRLSFERIRAACDFSALPKTLIPVAQRIVHACAIPDIIPDLLWEGDVPAAAAAALRSGKPILTDCRMAAEGFRTPLPANNPVLCFLDHPNAITVGTTRSAAAVELWTPHLDGAVAVIGNAPTALFRLLELLAAGAPQPALILAFPVGFVGAAESKRALAAARPGPPFLTLRGRRGGSAITAAALNALAGLASCNPG